MSSFAAATYLCLLDHSIFLKGMPSCQTARNTLCLWIQKIKIATLKQLQTKDQKISQTIRWKDQKIS